MRDINLVSLFDAVTDSRPGSIALVEQARRVTYAELKEASIQVADHLLNNGAQPGDSIGIHLPRSVELVSAILAVLRAGCAYVPIDPDSPATRILHTTTEAGIKLVLSSAFISPPSVSSEIVVLELDGVSQDCRVPASINPRVPTIDIDSLAYILYTSGSTGSPKGVAITHRNIVSLLQSTLPTFEFSHDDSWLLFHSYCFDFSVWEIWGALLSGSLLSIVPIEAALDPERLCRQMENCRTSILNIVPSVSRYVAEHLLKKRECPSSLRYIIFGGEPLDPHTLDLWRRATYRRGVRIVNMYGITEAAVHATRQEVVPSHRQWPPGGIIGQPLPHLSICLVDNDLRPVDQPCPGEILISGESLSPGYVGQPHLTEERFVFLNLPGAPTNTRWLRTGDLARRRPDGLLEFIGRLDDQVKIRGFRIELGEIEAIFQNLPWVEDVALAALPNQKNEKMLVAFVVPIEGMAPSSRREVMEQLKHLLPRYMIPSRVEFLESIPLTPSGKKDKKALVSGDISKSLRNKR